MTTQQLSLQMSLADSVTLQEELARWTEYAHDEHARAEEMTKEAESFAEECDSLRATGQAAEARALTWERQAIEYRARAEYLERMLALVRTGIAPSPRPGLDKDALTALLKIAHPDLSQTRPATDLAHELSVTINQMRKGVAS